MRHLTLLVTATVTAVLLAGCAAEQTTEHARAEAPLPSAQENGQKAQAIDIVDFTFSPEAVEVPVGTTVTWIQTDDSRHTVDFADGKQSGDLSQGDTFSRTFEEAGSYAYVCFFHPSMTGSVTVTG